MESQYHVRSLIHVHGVRKLKQLCGEAEEGGSETQPAPGWTNHPRTVGPHEHLLAIATFFLILIFFFLWPYCAAFGILVPSPGMELMALAGEAQYPSQWTAGKPLFLIFKHISASRPEAQSCWCPSPLGWLLSFLLPFPGESSLPPKTREQRLSQHCGLPDNTNLGRPLSVHCADEHLLPCWMARPKPGRVLFPLLLLCQYSA